MSSPPTQTSSHTQTQVLLEQKEGSTSPLPISHLGSPDAPANIDDGTAFDKSNQTVESKKHAALDIAPTEKVEISIDDASSPKPASEEIVVHCSIEDASATDAAMPEIIISAVGSNIDATQSAVAASTKAESLSPDESDEVKFIDPTDKTNDGDVVTYFFTSSTRKRPRSPVSSEPGCCNPHLHQDSDLYIKTRGKNGQVYVFEVVSTVLAKASAKFESMVYCTNVRGNREEWVWELPGNPLALKVMFCLLHNKFPRALLATKPKPSHLYAVFRILDQYEIDLETTNFHLLAKSWIEAFRGGLPGSKLGCIQTLYIARKLGDLKSLKDAVLKVAHDVVMGKDGCLLDEDGRRVQDVAPIDKELLEAIKTIRTKDIETVLKSLKDPYEYLMDAEKSSGQAYCKSADGHLECNQKLLGSLLTNLLHNKLFPIPHAQDSEYSFNTLAEKIDKMEIRGLFYPGVEMHKQRHTLCKLGQDAVVKKLRDGKDIVPLPDNLIEYMFFMCKRCGMFRDERNEFGPYKEIIRDLNMLYRDEFQKDVWGWLDADDSDAGSNSDESCDGEDSGVFGVADGSVWIERKA